MDAKKRITNDDFQIAMPSSRLLRRLWFESAQKCSVGILLFGFTAEAFNYPQTLGELLANNPKLKKPFDHWLNDKNPGRGVMTSGELTELLAREVRRNGKLEVVPAKHANEPEKRT